ncbi:hypothetical protein LPJ66_002655 [Kickxella alabastrina]|uniref:Uncharacterized protein n=1 Tax=Kickxella alabastrina TaxID=61397 RepID=A0ACC1IPT7_9FUNG|nr:hypothetical protein LPJ66_002655 [Kickxella alabastrina]
MPLGTTATTQTTLTTLTTLTTHSREISSPLTPLEERVFQRAAHSTTTPSYNVFDDDEVLKICDDQDMTASLVPQGGGQQQQQPAAAMSPHGWRLDGNSGSNISNGVGVGVGIGVGVGDTGSSSNGGGGIGNRIALRSRRLARMVASRHKGSAEGAQLLGARLAPTGGATPEDGRRRQQRWRKRRQYRRGAHADPALASVESGSFGLAEYAGGGGSTSTILPLRSPPAFAPRPHDSSRWRWRRGWGRPQWLQLRAPRLRSKASVAPSPAPRMHAFPAGGDEPKPGNAPPAAGRSVGSRVWGALRAFAMPGGYNRFGTRDNGAYTESVGFLLAFALASVAFIMWGVLAPKALCSTAQTFTAGDVVARKFVAANGVVADFTLSRTSFGSAMHGYSGYDVSAVFPLLGQLAPAVRPTLPGRTAALLDRCVAGDNARRFVERWRAESALFAGMDDDFPAQCPFPQSPQTSGAACLIGAWPQFAASKVGVVKVNASEVRDRHASAATSWVILDDSVYDVSMYLAYASDAIMRNGSADAMRTPRSETMFLPESLTALLIDRPGQDISAAFYALQHVDTALYKQCMDALFLRGTVLDTQSPFACANTNIVAWVTFGLYFLLLLVRFVVAEAYAAIRARRAVIGGSSGGEGGGAGSGDEEQAAGVSSCLIVVPCFDEPIETLTRTLQGIARSTHADAQTLLWVINDGDAAVLGSILRILSHGGGASDPKFYGASNSAGAGEGLGAARVYSGFYECGRHRIAYVVAAKEAYQGRVDSLMMVLNLFRSLREQQGQGQGQQQQQQEQNTAKTIFLEEELEAQMTQLGHAPGNLAHCLLLDASIMLDPLAITQLVAHMHRKPATIALSGALYPVGRPASLPQLLHFVSFYLRHFVSPICESLSGTTCPTDQLFTMYRVRLADGEPCLGDDQLVASMDALMKPSVRCRHRTWPANDCLLVPRLVRRFPQCRWAFESNGRAEIEVTPARMAAFDPYERQLFRSRLVTLFDIQRGRMRKRLWPIMFAHLLFPFMAPAATCMLYLEIVISVFGDSPAIVVSEITGAFLAATVLLLLVSRKAHLAVYFLVYSALAVPFYNVWIPVTAFLSMNRVWYSPEHLDAQRRAAEANFLPPANYEAIKSNYLRRFSEAREKSNPMQDLSSDSEPEDTFPPLPQLSAQPSLFAPLSLLPYNGNDSGGGLGLHITDNLLASSGSLPSFDLRSVVVNSALLAQAHAVLRQILADLGRVVELESNEFYLVCERALAVLIPAYPASSVAELAVAVNRAIEDILANRVLKSPVTTAPPSAAAAPPVAAVVPKFSVAQGSSAGYLRGGRPVSVIMEEESDEEH